MSDVNRDAREDLEQDLEHLAHMDSQLRTDLADVRRDLESERAAHQRLRTALIELTVYEAGRVPASAPVVLASAIRVAVALGEMR